MDPIDPETIGYLTVVEDERTGWTGGLLVVSPLGKPIEFQCTLPLRPTRAHEILFGPTLREHVIGDVIGPLLVDKCRTPLTLLCVDQPESLQIKSDVPVGLIDDATAQLEVPLGDAQQEFIAVPFAGSTMRIEHVHEKPVRSTLERWDRFPDALEPFERIRQAIAEAQSQIARARRSDTNDLPPTADAA